MIHIDTLSRPNIVLITMDECKYNMLGCYGNEDAVTPHMDHLAKEGMRFQHSYCTFPKCVPSRAALMTGRYPHVEGHRTLPGFEVSRGENNLVQELKRLGYRTAMFGKNHTLQADYCNECFDECHTKQPGLDVPWERRLDEVDDGLFRAFYRGPFNVIDEMTDTIATRAGIAFLNKQTSSEPFFLLMNYNAPHPPYTDIDPFIALIRDKKIKLPAREQLDAAPDLLRTYRQVYDLEGLSEADWRKVVEAYYGMVSYVDDQIGMLLQQLEDNGMRDQTIVILTSDHGDFAGEHGAVEKWDTMFYDCLIRVPLIIRYPGQLLSGQNTDAMVENIDIAPTILDLCGLEVPDWMQGRSLRGVLTGAETSHRDAVFCEGGVEEKALVRTAALDSEEHARRHPNYHWKQQLLVEHPWTLSRSKMIRTRKWKLVYRVNGMKELYDLEHDPEEWHDISGLEGSQPIIYALMEQLLHWAITTETDYPPIKKLNS
ncbi:sulfatase-like hydrolase/transferase [Paenibacillus sp. strain BS8-2]